MYHIHREKRVEQAIKMMQQSLGTAWRTLRESDVLILGHVLQCTWNTIDQKQWDGIPFGKMGMDTVREILTYSEGVSPGDNPSLEAVEKIRKILLAIK